MICRRCKKDMPESSFGEFVVKYTDVKGGKRFYNYTRDICNPCNNRRSVELAIHRALKKYNEIEDYLNRCFKAANT